MAKKMLIDAGQPEETRVVVAQGNRVEEFEFESSIRKQLKGNIYLAKVTRVEPSLQAAFVEYGGNRHGFLPLSEIHPDYYQIPLADREALLAEEAADAAAMAEEEEREEEEKANNNKKPRNRRRRRNNHKKEAGTESSSATSEKSDDDDRSAPEDGENNSPDADALTAVTEDLTPETDADTPDEEPVLEEAPKTDSDSDTSVSENAVEETAEEDTDGTTKAADNTSDRISEEGAEEEAEQSADTETADNDMTGAPQPSDKAEDTSGDDESDDEETDSDEDETVESVGADDDDERAQKRRQTRRRNYRIQEVIRRRQILLIQVVKEERGNKGAALTTYLSIAGRYCVLMPNTARGGGISRKITQAADRKRLKSITSELELPTGMGLIVRTAGAQRTKAEIKRDYDYLIRLWDNIRELTLESVAPCLIYEESNLIQRAIRDMYSKDVDTVMVQGEDAYRQAKDFMKMLMPSHAKNVQPYRDRTPLFQRFQVDTQLEQLLEPVVQLKSGGYLVINPTEALVSIDVNSGRSTKEKNVEDTAHATNLEAAEEIARQLRMRDLAGLIVIDFIDMEDNRNRKSVERKMKDALKSDRARIQVGRISHFGLLEMSRQRLGSSLLETYTMQCPACGGTGTVRTIDAAALKVMRGIEEEAVRGRAAEVSVTINPDIAVYILNHKRAYLSTIEEQYGLRVLIVADGSKTQDEYELQKTRNRSRKDQAEEQTSISATTFHPDVEDDNTDEDDQTEDQTTDQSDDQEKSSSEDGEDKPKRRRRRRRRRRKNNEDGDDNEVSADANAQDKSKSDSVADTDDVKQPAEETAEAPSSKAEEANTPEEKSDDQVTEQATPEPQVSEPQQAEPAAEVSESPAQPEAKEEEAERPKADEPKTEEPKAEAPPQNDKPKKRGWWQRRS